MRYLSFLIIAIAFFHTLSYAGYNWNSGNKPAAAGAFIMALLSLVFPVLIMFILG